LPLTITLNSGSHQIDGIIFDLDGTLVDSSLNFNLIRQQVGCPLGQDMLTFIATLADENQRQQAADLVIAHEMRDADQSRWLPGAQTLVNTLHQHNIPQAIVTRNSIPATLTPFFPATISSVAPLTITCSTSSQW